MSRKTATIVRTAILALALVNQILTALGKNPLPIEDAQLETLIAAAMTVAAALWSWWKNNSLTQEAQLADGYLDELKSSAKES